MFIEEKILEKSKKIIKLKEKKIIKS